MKARLTLYAPTRAQHKVHQSQHRNNVVRFGRQSGKSTYAINKLLDKGWKKQNGLYWYVGPTYRLATQMYRRTLYALPHEAILRKSDSELVIQLKSESTLFYKSSDNKGALLGETLDGAIIDECREQPSDIWPHYIMPMLGTTGGWADFLSTPNGMDWFYELDQRSLTDPEWGSFHAPSSSNPLWTPKMLDEARASMTEDLYAQEILAEYRELGAGSVYKSFGSTWNILDHNPFALTRERLISPYLPIVVAMDFNLNPMHWVLGQSRLGQFYWFDEIVLNNTNTHEAAEILCQRVAALSHKNLLIVGDASGKAGQRAAIAGQSDYDVIKATLRKHNITFTDKTPESNPTIKDRTNNVNRLLRSADGITSQWFHPQCKKTIKDMRATKWKEGSASLAMDKSNPEHTHGSDAIGYANWVLAPIKQVGQVGKLRIINRTI